MYDVVKIKTKNGYYLFKLGNILKCHHITVNKLITDLEMEYIVVKRLMTGNLTRIDLSVMERICDYLGCSMNDIINN